MSNNSYNQESVFMVYGYGMYLSLWSQADKSMTDGTGKTEHDIVQRLDQTK